MILVYSESKNLTIELLHKATDLAKELKTKTIAIIIGKDDDSLAQEYIAYGADKVLQVESNLEQYKAEEYADILDHIIKDTKTQVVLIGSDKNGKELASRLAGRLDIGCIIDATNVYIKDGKVTAERVVYSGNAISVEQFNSAPSVITVPSKVFDPSPKDDKRKGDIEKVKASFEKSASIVANVAELQSGGVNVEDAEIIVSCGRGMKNKEDLKLVNDLAEVLKGKTIGCSRPIAADLKWLPEEHWIGLSGHKVKPKLYIAAGISGQIQHIAGMRDSGVVVAINKDADALIFKSADYGIVGDLYKVLPKLTEAIKAKMG
ncbi:MAG: electron transfer flavoprotein subunit alpha/FixB family protein [Candidatus Thermoplasmatota archaeon]|nr:electron transfer flavoprotein subunit alpha/FixB family protein [Candidatus Thermoplasmatota archaeon]